MSQLISKHHVEQHCKKAGSRPNPDPPISHQAPLATIMMQQKWTGDGGEGNWWSDEGGKGELRNTHTLGSIEDRETTVCTF
jgi:hypothetical protein